MVQRKIYTRMQPRYCAGSSIFKTLLRTISDGIEYSIISAGDGWQNW